MRRIERRGLPLAASVVLADCSFSMAERDGPRDMTGWMSVGTGPRRIDRLARILAYVLARTRLQALVCFSDIPVEVVLAGAVLLPEPSGGTALHLALDYVAAMRPAPLRVMVLSDGAPNDAQLALAAASRLAPIVIDGYFVGADGDVSALEFMARLAAAGGPGGRSGRFDLSETALVGEAVLLRLAGPRP